MNKNNNMIELTCSHCNYKWYPKYVQHPKCCPRCKSYRYGQENQNDI